MPSRDSIINNNDECVNCSEKNKSELTNEEKIIQFSHLNSIHLKEDEPCSSYKCNWPSRF